MNVKLSYTNTLSRPNYGDFIPSWKINEYSIDWNNPYIEPALSTNWDLYFSFFTNKTGLFTVGAFHKNIEKMIMKHGSTIITQAMLDENVFDGLPITQISKDIDYMMNNPRDAKLYGFETEWQSNFWFLPGVLKGIVLNVNYTHFQSDADYPDVYRYSYREGRKTIVVAVDTFYTARLIDQADDIFNLTVGYDYKKFSIRASMKYTDDLFRQNEDDPRIRKFTDERFDYDISIRQGLPWSGVSAYCNLTNLGRSRYTELNAGSRYPTLETYGGLGMIIGLRYRM